MLRHTFSITKHEGAPPNAAFESWGARSDDGIKRSQRPPTQAKPGLEWATTPSYQAKSSCLTPARGDDSLSEGRATHNSWRSVTMNALTTREPANDPQDLERLLVARENAGDVAGMTALFEPEQ